jgi:hypothetical protein
VGYILFHPHNRSLFGGAAVPKDSASSNNDVNSTFADNMKIDSATVFSTNTNTNNCCQNKNSRENCCGNAVEPCCSDLDYEAVAVSSNASN